MSSQMVDEKFANFSIFIKEKATKLGVFKEYDDKARLTKMIHAYVKPAFALGQVTAVSDSMCDLIGITDCCDRKRVSRYLEFFAQAL